MTDQAPGPWLTVAVPVRGADPALESTLESVRALPPGQVELLLAPLARPAAPQGGAGRAGVPDRVPEVEAPEGTVAVRTLAVVPGPGGAAWRNAVLAAAAGTFLLLLEPGDRLVPQTLRVLRAAVGRRVDLVYAGETDPGAHGAPGRVVHKPAWSPERLRTQPYTGRMVALRTATVRDLGGWRTDHEGALDRDLVLRVAEASRKVVAVPEVLCHRGSALPEVDAAAELRAVQEHLDRVGIAARAVRRSPAGGLRLERGLDPEVLVSVVIPTRGSSGPAGGSERVYVVEAVRSLLARAGHEHLEVVVVHDPDTPPVVLEELRRIAGERLLLTPYPQPFNFSTTCNVGVLASHGSLLVLLNDDVEILSDRFLPRLLGPLAQRDVGATGAKLLYDDGTVQHAGIAMPVSGPWHAFRGWPGDAAGPGDALLTTREVSGVTAACLGVRRRTFDLVGGLTERLPLAYNDVDFSLKIGARGLRRLWVADAVAHHFESKSRTSAIRDWERELLHARWALPRHDPFFPPPRASRRLRPAN